MKNEKQVYYKVIEKEAPIAPHVYIKEDVYNLMMALVDECDKEVGWLMCVEKEDNAFIQNHIAEQPQPLKKYIENYINNAN